MQHNFLYFFYINLHFRYLTNTILGTNNYKLKLHFSKKAKYVHHQNAHRDYDYDYGYDCDFCLHGDFPRGHHELLNQLHNNQFQKLLFHQAHKELFLFLPKTQSDLQLLKTYFQFARAINHSHETIREFFDLSCPEIEWIVKRINELEPNLEHLRNPVTCGRLTGKGYGRCIYSIMRDIDVENYKQKLLEFEKIFGFHPVTFEVECEDGARIVV